MYKAADFLDAPRSCGASKRAVEAHRATPAEQWRYGVEWRRTGSAWYTQKRAPHYPAPEGYKGLAPVYAAFRAEMNRRLGQPQAFKLTGDGKHAAKAIKAGPCSFKQLAEARYRDWQAAPKPAIKTTPAPPPATAPIIRRNIPMPTTTNQHIHREAWLNAVIAELRAPFAAIGAEIPAKVRVACGFPSRSALNGVRNQRIGECWSNTVSGDNHVEIFISPVIADPMRAAGILAHELIHAAVGVKAGHKAPFKRVAKAIGLEGKMTATTEGEAFKRLARPILEAVGPYPHGELHAMTNGRKKQVARLIKCECSTCGYVVRTAQSWIDDKGAPHCPEHGEMEIRMMRTARQAAIDKGRRTVVLPLELLLRLEPHARRRNIHRNQVAREIIESAVDAGLVDAVLDDGPTE